MGIGCVISKSAAIFFDRDGVLNKAIVKAGKPYPPAALSELEINTDASACLQQLKSAGFVLIGATNQPDVARGKTEQTLVEAINKTLLDKLSLTKIFSCYHDDSDHCHCRKPAPGLLLQAAREFQLDLSLSFMIGDRWKDIAAGKAAGCRSIWLDYGYDEQKPTAADYITSSLTDATAWILQVATNRG